MISEHVIGWVASNPAGIEEVAFRYPDRVIDGQRVDIISTVKNNTNVLRRAKLSLLNAQTNQQIESSEGNIGPFATVDIKVDHVVDTSINYKTNVEEI